MGKQNFILAFVLFCLCVYPVASASAASPQKIATLENLAQRGDTRAMCDLARIYYQGKGVLKDPSRARCWVEKAHGRGDKKAKRLWDKWKLWQYPAGPCYAAPVEESAPSRNSFVEPTTGMAFVWVSGGCFKMGCNRGDGDCDGNASPRHRVCLDGYWMGVTEVTQGQWMALMAANPSRFRGKNLPVERVSFSDVQAFIQVLNGRSDKNFALPTEAQWEYAARNRGGRIAYPWGDEEYMPPANCGTCNSAAFRGRTAPVGQFAANGLGLHDMGGNVGEWCRDFYSKTAYTRHKKNNPWVRKGGSQHVVRGGSYSDNAGELRSTRRRGMLNQTRSEGLGFRLIANP